MLGLPTEILVYLSILLTNEDLKLLCLVSKCSRSVFFSILLHQSWINHCDYQLLSNEFKHCAVNIREINNKGSVLNNVQMMELNFRPREIEQEWISFYQLTHLKYSNGAKINIYPSNLLHLTFGSPYNDLYNHPVDNLPTKLTN